MFPLEQIASNDAAKQRSQEAFSCYKTQFICILGSIERVKTVSYTPCNGSMFSFINIERTLETTSPKKRSTYRSDK